MEQGSMEQGSMEQGLTMRGSMKLWSKVQAGTERADVVTRRSRQRSTTVLVAVSCWLLAPHRAHASSSYPDVVHTTWNTPTVPACTLCHKDLNGGYGTVVSPFGISAMTHGAQGNSPSSLRAALKAMSEEKVSSLKDGVPDIDKLQAGKDPNVAGAPETANAPPPTYGCGGAHFAAQQPARAPQGLWLLGLLGLAPLVRWRRRAARVVPSSADR